MISWLTALNVVSFSLLAIAILCRLSPTFKFYFKTLALYMNVIFTSIFTIPYGLVYYGQHGRICVFAASVCLWFGEMMGVRYRIEVEGDVVDKKKGFIVVCNHQSALDVTAMSKIWSTLGPTSVMVKSSLQYYGPFGVALTLMGCVFIDRSSEAGRKAVNAAGRAAKARGYSIWLFPEGTRNESRDFNLLPFKKGGFHVAVDAGMPILPVVVSQYDFYDVADRRFDGGEAVIKILSPIETEGKYTKDNIDELVELTRNTMVKEFKALSKPDAKKSQ